MSGCEQGRGTVLYRFFDAEGRLLYVGVTRSGAARWVQHSLDQSWWSEVACATLEHHGVRADALEAESAAIRAEHPLYNVLGSPGGPKRASTRDDRPRSSLVRFPPDMLEEIAAQLSYGESRNEWIVGACRQRLDGGAPARRKAGGTRLDDLLGPAEAAKLATEAGTAPSALRSVGGFDPDEDSR